MATTAPGTFAVGIPTASAQSLDDDYWISGMAFFPRIDTKARVQTKTQNIVGTDVDFERDLDLDNNEILPSVNAGARFGRVIINADFYKLKRTGDVELARDITFDNATYLTSARVDSGFDTDIYRLTIGYAFVQNDTAELGAAIGVHATTFDLSIHGEATVNGGSGVTTRLRRRDFLAPLPTVGLFGTYKIADNVLLNGRVDYLSLKVGDYDGKLVNAQAGVIYQFAKNFAIGPAYRYVYYRVGVDKKAWEGRVKYRLHGPAVVLQASF